MGKKYDLLIKARGETSDADRALRQLQKSVERTGKRMSSMGRTMSLAVTAPLIGLGVMGARELGEIEKANAQTATAIARLGPKSLISVKGVQTLAAALQEKSGIDDQAIQSGQNLLLSIGRINGATGDGAKAFRAASVAMVGFSEQTGAAAEVAGKQFAASMAAAAAGTLKLPRGLKATVHEQKQLEKAMDSASSAAERQLVVAEFLRDRFANSMVLTNADKWAVATDKLAGSAAKLVVMALPAFDRLVDGLGRLTGAFDGLSPRMQRVVGAGLLVAGALGPVLIVLGSLVTASSALIPVLVGITLPMLGVAAGLAALGVALVVAYKKSERFREVVNGAFRSVASGVRGVLGSLRVTISVWMGWATAAWARWGAGITSVVRPLLSAYATFVGTWLANVRDVIKMGLAVLRGDWSGAWSLLKGVVSRTFSAVVSIARNGGTAVWRAVSGLGGKIVGLKSEFLSAGRRLGRAVVDGIIEAIRNAAGEIGAAASNAAQSVLGGGGGRAGGGRGRGRSAIDGKGGSNTISAMGNIFGSSISAAQVLSFATESTMQPYSVTSNDDGTQTLNTNSVAVDFLKRRLEERMALLRDRLSVRNGKARQRTRLQQRYARLRGQKAAAVRARNPALAASKGAEMARVLGRIVSLTDEIETLDAEILTLGGEIQSDNEALIPPEVDTTPDDSSGASGSGSGSSYSGASGGVTAGGASSVLDNAGVFTPVALTSASALSGVYDTANRAMTAGGANVTINAQSADAEAIARRVAFILGGSRLRSGGAF